MQQQQGHRQESSYTFDFGQSSDRAAISGGGHSTRIGCSSSSGVEGALSSGGEEAVAVPAEAKEGEEEDDPLEFVLETVVTADGVRLDVGSGTYSAEAATEQTAGVATDGTVRGSGDLRHLVAGLFSALHREKEESGAGSSTSAVEAAGVTTEAKTEAAAVAGAVDPSVPTGASVATAAGAGGGIFESPSSSQPSETIRGLLSSLFVGLHKEYDTNPGARTGAAAEK